MSTLRIFGCLIGILGFLATFFIYRGARWNKSNFIFLMLLNISLITITINPNILNVLRDSLSLQTAYRKAPRFAKPPRLQIHDVAGASWLGSKRRKTPTSKTVVKVAMVITSNHMPLTNNVTVAPGSAATPNRSATCRATAAQTRATAKPHANSKPFAVNVRIDRRNTPSPSWFRR